MPTPHTPSTASRQFRIAYLVLALGAGFLILNLAADILLSRRLNQGRQAILNAADQSKTSFMLICHDNWDTPYFDFTIADAQKHYARVTAPATANLNTPKPMKCVRYPSGARSIQGRMAGLPPPAPGVRRLVIIGDSFTFGEGVQWGNAFPETLERYAAWFGEPGTWEIINLGLMGKDFPGLYDESFKAAMALKPGMILYAWLPNDTPRGSLHYPDILTSAPYYNSPGYFQSLRGVPLSKLLNLIVIKRRINDATLRWFHTLNGPENARGMDSFRKVVRRMRDESGAAGVDFRAALFPLMAGAPGKYPFSAEHAYVAELMKSQGVPVLDLAPSVIDRPAPQLWVHAANYHPDTTAQRNAARALANDLHLTWDPMPGLRDAERQRGAHGAARDPLARALARETLEFPESTLYLSDSRAVLRILDKQFGLRTAASGDKAAHLQTCSRPSRCVRVTLHGPHYIPEPAFDPGCLPVIHTPDKTLRLCEWRTPELHKSEPKNLKPPDK